ncbi:hypothetical protein O3G_MSEX012110 [Manduca sexta]|uniref:Pacifastin domain-containing protein n=1 Tax=Manduca sexta TaxID=7130 RepID=A0A921ZPE1_MANSE|nr:hypothetical protein O3G_MSEX012110 [Manduca sexta]
MRCIGVFVFIYFYIADSSYAFDDTMRIQTCSVGDVVQNECLKCICNTKRIYKCTPKHCYKTSTEKVSQSNINACQPNMIYTTDTMTCICDKTGQWPHRKCKEIFQTLNTNNSCEPNSYVILDCNICRCGSNGRIEEERCTQNVCKKHKLNTRRLSNVYGSCEVRNWYSLAPCQFCYCVSQNKLVCNTGNNYAKKLDLGTYHLNECGKGLIYEAIALIPDNDLTLRFGNFMTNSVTSTPKLPKHVIQDNHNVVINVEKENKIESKEKDSDESSSDSDENKPMTTKIVKNIPSTQIYSDGENTSKENGYTDNKEADSGMEIGVEVAQIPKKTMRTTKKITLTTSEPKSLEDFKKLGQDLGMKLKMTLPRMLDQMFKMALRKSMLSVKKDTKCVPGTTEAVKCNMCFCMKNGKLLCTNNVCE